MSLPSRFSVLVAGSSAPGRGRVRDLLDADDDVHGRTLLPTGHRGARRVRSPTTAGRHRPRGPVTSPWRPVRAPAHRQLVRLVGHGPQHRARRSRRFGDDARRHRSSRRTAGATPPASPRTRPAAASTWSSAFGGDGTRERGGQRARRHATPRSAVLPGGSTNVFARTHRPAQRSGRRRPRRSPTASTRAASRRVGLGPVNGRYFCFHTGVGFDAAVVARGRAAGLGEALGRPPAVHLAGAARRGSSGYDRHRPALPGAASPTAREVPDGYFTICLNTNPYTYLGNRPLDLSPARRRSTAGWWPITFRTLRGPAVARAARPARCGAAACRDRPHRRPAPPT